MSIIKGRDSMSTVHGERAWLCRLALCAVLLVVGLPAVGSADELDSGDTAWMLTSTALVLFMTIPGLALFYGGLVRVKNVLSVLMQCFAITGIAVDNDRQVCRTIK